MTTHFAVTTKRASRSGSSVTMTTTAAMDQMNRWNVASGVISSFVWYPHGKQCWESSYLLLLNQTQLSFSFSFCLFLFINTIKILTKMLCMWGETFFFTLSSKKVHAAVLEMWFSLRGVVVPPHWRMWEAHSCAQVAQHQLIWHECIQWVTVN